MPTMTEPAFTAPKAKIKLSDGTVLGPFEINGTCYMTKQQYSKEFFEGKLSPVTITEIMSDGQEYPMNHPHMEFSNCMPYDEDGNYLLVIYDIPKEEIERRRMESNIEFLAMMTDVSLD